MEEKEIWEIVKYIILSYARFSFWSSEILMFFFFKLY